MKTVLLQSGVDDPVGTEGSLVRLVSSIGHQHFGLALASYLQILCGAHHVAAFRMGRDELSDVVACCVQPERTAHDRVDSYIKEGWWKRDPAMAQVQLCLQESASSVVHLDFSHHGYADMRPRVYPHVCDRVLLGGRSANSFFGMSVLRDDPHSPFGESEIDQLNRHAELLVSVMAKHSDVIRSRPSVATALTSLLNIETCIGTASGLPRREAEVCARILYGLSSTGIALDLLVSEETVKTYRKRAYQRLNIGSQRELLTWYLARWSTWTNKWLEADDPRALH